jgi:hypothetical protein
MRVRFRILALLICIVLTPLLYAAGRRIVVGEYFTGTW